MRTGRGAVGLLLAVSAVTTARADGVAPVIRVGSAELSADAVARRLARIPAYQLSAWGTPAEAQKRLVETVLVPELLYAEEGEARNLRREPGLAYRLDDALVRALGDSLRREIEAAGPTDAELRAYHQTHRADYDRPERLRLSRILVPDEALARSILAEAKGAGGLERWNLLAREKSLDTATKMRGGMLGFVHPNGHTDVPQVGVDPALYEAAKAVRNGELVPSPVKEGERFAVVWRRGSLPASMRSFDEERDRIWSLLVRERHDGKVRALLAELRQREVRDVDAAAVEFLKDQPEPAAPTVPRVAVPLGSTDPVPRPTERGLR